MDDTEGMSADGGAPETNNDAPAQASEGAVSAPAAPSPQQPQQPQGPDWSQLQRYGDPETLAKQAEWFNGFAQKYSDPAFAQQFDKLYNGPGQQQQHPYDWMIGDDARMQALREKGEQHPDHPRLVQEFTNFFHNPIGALSGYANHPKVVEAIYGAMQPMLQDFVSRSIQPLQQYVHQQGEQQFQQMYGKAYQALPDHIKQAHQQGRFGEGRQGVINAIEFGKSLPQTQPPAVGAAPAKDEPKATNKNTAKSPEAKKPGERRSEREDDAEFAKELRASLARK